MTTLAVANRTGPPSELTRQTKKMSTSAKKCAPRHHRPLLPRGVLRLVAIGEKERNKEQTGKRSRGARACS